MLPSDTITSFLAASIILAIVPGPDNIFVLTQSALHGTLAGIMVTLGLCTGLLVHTAAAAVGIAAVIQTSTVAFSALKFVGAGYLLYLAWQSFRAKGCSANNSSAQKPDVGTLYRRGIIMNITNPKVSTFFLAFLPQFIEPRHATAMTQTFFLGSLFISVTLTAFGGVALLASSLSDWVSESTHGQLILNRIAGVVFVCLALSSVLTQR